MSQFGLHKFEFYLPYKVFLVLKGRDNKQVHDASGVEKVYIIKISRPFKMNGRLNLINASYIGSTH